MFLAEKPGPACQLRRYKSVDPVAKKEMMPFTITTQPEELTEGLFGQVFLHVFEILPYLDENRLHPKWNIRSLKYGIAPDHTIIPGLLDVNDLIPESASAAGRPL